MRSTILAVAMAVAMAVAAIPVTATEACPSGDYGQCPPEKRVWVCKYVGKPGVDETLKDGKNPIEVAEDAIPVDPPVEVGDEFADAQGRSIVVQIGGEDPGVVSCPEPERPEPPKPEPPKPPVQEPPVQQPAPPAPIVQPQPAPQPAPQPFQRYAPKAKLVICGDPRVKATYDNSLSTMAVRFKMIFKDPRTSARRVAYHWVKAGQVHVTEWRWVRGNGNWVRVRGQYQEFLARIKVIDPTPWGEGACPNGLYG